MMYNWELPDWPDFKFDLSSIEDTLLAFAMETGHINGLLQAMPNDLQMETIIQTMVSEAIKTSEIEGEYLSRQDVVSSIRNNLGLNPVPDKIKDEKAMGVSILMVDVRNSYADILTEDKLFEWHKMLLMSNSKINTGMWRIHEAPMQVVSGAFGREVVHFEAPPSSRVPDEMKAFITWFNDTAPKGKKEIKQAPIRSAIAHLYFESIHPFEDGNGRIGRAIAEKALAQTIGRPVLLSLSRTIDADKKEYYQALKNGQKDNVITGWISYFVQVILAAQEETKALINLTLKKVSLFDYFQDKLNERQLKVMRKMFDLGLNGFEGGMTAKKYISITKTSKATATRDLQELVELGAFLPFGGGRSVHYALNLNNIDHNES